MKENKLIAEFMEYPNLGTKGDFSYLKYHKSWDWLMPVVEKIENLGYEFFIVEDRVKVSHNTDHSIETIIDLTSRSKLNATYNAVVEFINQYNKNKRDETI